MSRPPVLVGELNPYGGDPYFALYCEPPESSGGRLCRKILAIPRHVYLEFPRYNLCVGKWSAPKARAEAQRIRREQCVGHKLVLLGSKVCGAFGVPYVPCTVQEALDPGDGTTYVVLPHPSGLSRFWNEPGAFECARAAVQREFPHIKFGTREES